MNRFKELDDAQLLELKDLVINKIEKIMVNMRLSTDLTRLEEELQEIATEIKLRKIDK